MKRFDIVFIGFLFFLNAANAQFSVAPQFGLSYAKFGGDLTNARYIPKIRYGLIANLPFNESFSFQPGIMFNGKGTSLYYDETDEDALVLNYLEFPLNAVLNADLDIGTLQFYFGPYLAFAYNGKYKYLSDENGLTEKISIGTSPEDEIKPTDLGLNIGAGYLFEGIQVHGGFSGSFSNISNEKDDRLLNVLITISMAYFFEF